MAGDKLDCPYLTVGEVSEIYGLSIEAIIRRFEAGAQAIHKRVTVIHVEANDASVQFEIEGFNAAGIAEMRNKFRKDVPGMEGISNETAVRIESVSYKPCDLQDLADIEQNRGRGYVILRESLPMSDEASKVESAPQPSPRAETTFLNIIGAMLGLMLGKTPAGRPQSLYEDQVAVISALLANYGGKPGISQRTLEEKFAAGKRSVTAE